ncbi:MAG: hypothetical protein IKN04_16530 [Clostridia bacterium]|nr:hypothetical protein [Clostridia bacterium]
MEWPEKKNVRARMQGCLLSVIVSAGVMMGLDTVKDCMGDPVLRPFLGNALLKEIMPCMGLGKDTLDPLAVEICGEMENPTVVQPLALLMPNAVRAWRDQVLPVLKTFEERECELPPCLCMSLSLLIMLFSGARQDGEGRYTYLKNGETCYFNEDEEILFSFSRLSCDMPPESLAYAALSDRAIWEEDLREIPGLEDKVSAQLRDLQLLGLMEAMGKTWENYEK